MIEIAPSILAADFARLGEEVRAVERAGATMLHVDVMDGHFVPNLTIGLPVVRSLRRATEMTLDCHLMIENADRYAEEFVEAGAGIVTVHQEACPHLHRTLTAIRAAGAEAGVTINPATPVSTLEEAVEWADLVLIMSVNPGFGGQQFIPSTLEKVRRLAEWRSRRDLHFRIEIDGGITLDNAGEAARAGCDIIVAGTAIFHTPDPGQAVREMMQAAERAVAVRV